MNAPAHRESAVGEISTLLGRGSEFEGKLTFEGTVRIDGTLKGEVFSDDVLVVGEGARIQAEIDIGEIIIQGTVEGNIRAKRSVEIIAPGRVKGDVTTPSLQIERGVIFEGRSFMEGIAEAGDSIGASAYSPPASSGSSSVGGKGVAKAAAGKSGKSGKSDSSGASSSD